MTLWAPDGTSDLDAIAGPLFDQAGLHWEYIAENTPVLQARQVQDYDGLLVLGAGITAETFTDADRLAIIARFGVGYDKVDVEACTRKWCAAHNCPLMGFAAPVATSIMTFVLSLSHQLLIKDRLTRAGGWRDTKNYMGMGLVGRTLGLVGMGQYRERGVQTGETVRDASYHLRSVRHTR